MKKLSQDSKICRKLISPVSTDDGFNKTPNQGFFSGHRLTYVSCFVVVTFIVCITQEFTFVFNYTGLVRTIPVVLADFRNTSRTYMKNTTVDDWKRVYDTVVYVYSAFWDDRSPNESLIRIIGAADFRKHHLDETKCLVKHSNSTGFAELPAKYEYLLEHHKKPSKAILIHCTGANGQPDHVALVPVTWNETWPPPAWLRVHDTTFEAKTIKIGLCVRPMYGNVDAFRVAEFVAYYAALGVQHFAFYAYQVSDNVTNFLQELRRSGYSVDVLPWTLPREMSSIWSYGQMSSINDCMYRQMKDMSYTLVVDVDEFVTPRKVVTLEEFLIAEDDPEKNYGSFVFRSTVFCDEFERDVLPSYIPPFVTQSAIKRNDYIYPIDIRSKYVAKPALVQVAGIHYVWFHVPEYETKMVAARQVLVHHHRSELCLDQNSNLPVGVVDVTSRKYLNQLLRSKAVEVWREMFQ